MIHGSVVLVVDDDASVRHALAHVLTCENFRVVGAANGQEALRGLGENRIDVALVDQDLGDESGAETLKQLRELRPGLPAILMTGRPEQAAIPAEQPGDTFMRKPLDLPLLFQTLGSLASPKPMNGSRRIELR